MKTLFASLLACFATTNIDAQNSVIDFRVYRSECFSVLTWTTPKSAKEMLFEVEKSYNNMDFVRVGETTFSGVYYQFKTYEYTDVDTTQASTYYRLKLIKPNYEEVIFAERVIKVN